MTKANFIKNKEVMNWFYENNPECKPVIAYIDDDMVEIYNPTWLNDTDYIINDDYIEFRKAIYNGKKFTWRDGLTLDSKHYNGYFSGLVKEYKIVEDDFEIGEWIVFGTDTIKRILDKMDGYYKVDSGLIDKKSTVIKRWKPRTGDYYWRTDYTNPQLCQMNENDTFYSSYMEPFIGQIPTTLKEIK